MSHILGLDVSKAYTEQEFTLGEIAEDNEGNAFQFVQANGALSVGDVVSIEENGDASPATTTTTAPGTGQGLPAAVVVTALADDEYGWVQRRGVVDAINVATDCAAHTELNSTGTGGQVDDDAGAGAEVIEGLTTTASESSNAAAGVLNWPYVGRTLA